MEQSKNNDYLVIKENLIVNQNIDCEENLLVKDSMEINSGVSIRHMRTWQLVHTRMLVDCQVRISLL